MKKILIMALTMAGLSYLSAEAQSTAKSCGTTQAQVCAKGRGCYKTPYAENFPVCKGDHGYFICCEKPGRTNATHSAAVPMLSVYQDNNRSYDEYVNVTDEGTTVQSQSYPKYTVNRTATYQGYYPQKGKMRICYMGDNVAELNANPYHGCPSPQDDGPEKNNQRNENVVTPVE